VTTLNLSYYQTKLTNIQAAITKILEAGQDMSLSDKRIIYARLGNLFEEQSRLEKIIAGLEGSGSPLVRNYGILKR
jgi:hypothetical protein